jgi:cytochrome c biogenesis protein CcdA
LNENLLWLLYCVSGVLAFAAVYKGRWRIGLAVLAGGLVTAIGWLLLFRFTEVEHRPEWIRLDLSLNLTFGLMFAAAGAALAWHRIKRRNPAN